jgi:hypothetical protein
MEAVRDIYRGCLTLGLDTLLDDRDARPGVRAVSTLTGRGISAGAAARVVWAVLQATVKRRSGRSICYFSGRS